MIKRLASPEEQENLRKLRRLCRGHYWLMPVVVALGLLASLLEGISLSLVIPLLHAVGGDFGGETAGGGFVNAIRGVADAIPPDWRLPIVLAAVLVGICLKNLVSYASFAAFSVVDRRIGHQLRTRLFKRLMSLPLARLDDDQAGRLYNVLIGETWRTSEALRSVFSGITSVCTILVFVSLLLLLSWQLTILAVLCLAVVPPAVQVVTAGLQALSRRFVDDHAKLASRAWAGIGGWRVVQTFGRRDFEVERFARTSDAVADTGLRLTLISGRAGPATEILVTGIIVLMALTLHWGLADLATLAAFVVVLYRLQPRVRELIPARAARPQRQGAVDAVVDMLGHDRGEGIARPTRGPIDTFRQTICFDHVSFRYERADLPAVQDVSFTIRRGTATALVGPSGAGKSTLLDLLLGFYEPQSGRILVDDTDLEELDRDAWRARLAVVSQDPYLFDDTVRHNILYGRLDADEAALVAAARLAHADSFIERLPDGYDTVIGERGVKLSGGQRQRLTLARALIREPDILILDEATNALDSITEQAFQEALAGIAGRCTVIIVAHRLSTIETADHIVVLDGGRVVEQGGFRELRARNGLFARLSRLQNPESPSSAAQDPGQAQAAGASPGA